MRWLTDATRLYRRGCCGCWPWTMMMMMMMTNVIAGWLMVYTHRSNGSNSAAVAYSELERLNFIYVKPTSIRPKRPNTSRREMCLNNDDWHWTRNNTKQKKTRIVSGVICFCYLFIIVTGLLPFLYSKMGLPRGCLVRIRHCQSLKSWEVMLTGTWLHRPRSKPRSSEGRNVPPKSFFIKFSKNILYNSFIQSVTSWSKS